jgi:hypothetical protein
MSVLNRIAFYQNRRDEVPNQELAADLARRRDTAGIQEISENLDSKNKSIRSDCLKVLYEIGYLEPELIAPYANEFLELLDDRNNRMVWGAMIALATIAELNHNPIWGKAERLISAIDSGSLITLVWGIRALSRVAAKSTTRIRTIMPRLLQYIKTCNARDIPTHLESMLPVITNANWASLEKAVESRKMEMTSSHLARLKKVLKQIPLALGNEKAKK